MRRIALRSLAHERGKLLASLAGVAIAAALLVVQIGIYAGFQDTSTTIIRHAGGDLWVMPAGTEVIDTSEALSAGTYGVVASHPCVKQVRGMIHAFSQLRRPNGTSFGVVVVGLEPKPGDYFPWNFSTGYPSDIKPGRVAIDRMDLGKLLITRNPIGSRLEIAGETVYVSALTEGIQSFTLSPFVFAEINTARRLVQLSDGQVHYWLVELKDKNCAASVAAHIERLQPDLQVRTRDEFADMTATYWVMGSGAGTALGFSALLALVVGAVIVGQTLYSVTRDHLRELATLKAIGATSGEVVSFVAWQAAFLAVVGGMLGFGLSLIVRAAVQGVGINVALTEPVILVGVVCISVMCALASIGSILKVLKLEAAEVFR